ncbi:MAG: hypothetical protein ACREB3_08935 [Burkholderiales bacterium]
MNALKRLLRLGPVEDESLPAVEILKRTPPERLEETVRALMERRSAAEVRQAMIDLLATAPLAHFATLRSVFLAHCADEGRQ